MNILLSRILKYLNGTLFLDDAYRFCVFFILHYQDFDSYTIEDIAGELQTWLCRSNLSTGPSRL